MEYIWSVWSIMEYYAVYSFNYILNIFLNLFNVVFQNISKKNMLIFTCCSFISFACKKGQ